MAAEELHIPPLVRQRAMAHGVEGQRWLEALPEVVGGLADRWGLRLGGAFAGGTAAFVVAASDEAGRPCVLKVATTFGSNDADSFRRSVLVHHVAGGRGCAGLLAHDESAPAMLLERLGPNLDDLGMSLSSMLETIASTLRSFWRPLGDDCPVPTGAQQAVRLADHIAMTWEALGRPCPREVIDLARGYCDERAAAFDPALAVLVHGDAHGWNTLHAVGDTYKFVDPEGLRSEPAHDLGVPMREYNRPLLAGDTSRLVRQRAELLASICDLDPEPIWQWGFIERVSTGLANLRDFEGDDGNDFLEVAARSR